MANFDRVLPEDPSVNSLVRFRLSTFLPRRHLTHDPQLDSFQIWKTICESKLLGNATFILLLNKMDLLRAKLQSGERVSLILP